jgi:hypothetical protein
MEHMSDQSSRENKNTIPVKGISLGRLFEVGFDAGVLSAISQLRIEHPYQDFYVKELRQFKCGAILTRLCDDHSITDLVDRDLLKQWMVDFLRRGWLAGLTFFREYVDTIGKPQHLKIRYLQVDFGGENSFGMRSNAHVSPFLLSSLGLPDVAARSEALSAQYSQQGEFLKADTLLLLEYAPRPQKKRFFLLCVDESIYWAQRMSDLYNIHDIQQVRSRIKSWTNTARSKSFFTRLNIETGQEILDFPTSLRSYFHAFSRTDKESTKMIQAGSYAYSFYQFLLSCGYLNATTQVRFTVAGCSDQQCSTMTVVNENIAVLQACYDIYSEKQKKETPRARRDVLQTIKRNTKRSFPGEGGHAFIENLFSLIAQEVKRRQTDATAGDTPRILSRVYEETLTNFCSTACTLSLEDLKRYGFSNPVGALPFKAAHSDLILKALKDTSIRYLFLTGSPGVGKTHTIIEYLLNECVHKGFLFVYISPRKQVNIDIVKRLQKNGRLRHDDVITLNSTSALIDEYGQETVEYRRNTPLSYPEIAGVRFVPAEKRMEQSQELSHHRNKDQLGRTNDEALDVRSAAKGGVLKSLCLGVKAVMEQQVARCIVATASIQSLKKVEKMDGEDTDTLRHFKTLFEDIYDERDGVVLWERMPKLQARFQHMIFMVDEVTGDEGGVEFVRGMSDLLESRGLFDPRCGINTKFIIADASLVGTDVITQHFSQQKVSPDKVFFKRIHSESVPALSSQPYGEIFPGAVVINANSFPASALCLRYHVSLIIPAKPRLDPIDPGIPAEPSMRDVVYQQQHDIEEKVVAFFEQAGEDQIIVYIQNKARLFQLIDRVEQRLNRGKPDNEESRFQRGRDYLEIHADIAPDEQQAIDNCRDQVRVIFMTSSASRGLSFPKAQHILVDIPRFDLAKNLMEIIQVVYRGRGNDDRDLGKKELTFYFADYVSPLVEQIDIAMQESILHLFNMLLLVKLALLTRIQGYGEMGTDRVQIIPLGGKAISTAFSTFSEAIADVLKALTKEIDRRRTDRNLRDVYDALKQLCTHSDTSVTQELKTRNQQAILSPFMFEALSNPGFFRRIEGGLHHLLDLQLEPIYVEGELLLVPLKDTLVREDHLFRLAQEIQRYANQSLIRKMHAIAVQTNTYTEHLRTSIKVALELLKKIEQTRVDRTQFVRQKSKGTDRYYAIPQSLFTSREAFEDYFKQKKVFNLFSLEDWKGDDNFRSLLGQYLHAYYPIENVVPVASDYDTFPYVLFRSHSLPETRKNRFTERYMFTSNDFNILNVILSREEEGDM